MSLCARRVLFYWSKPLASWVCLCSECVGQDVCRAAAGILELFWLLWGVIAVAIVQSEHAKPCGKQGKHILWHVLAVPCAWEQQGWAGLQGQVTWKPSAGCKPSRADLAEATKSPDRWGNHWWWGKPKLRSQVYRMGSSSIEYLLGHRGGCRAAAAELRCVSRRWVSLLEQFPSKRGRKPAGAYLSTFCTTAFARELVLGSELSQDGWAVQLLHLSQQDMPFK